MELEELNLLVKEDKFEIDVEDEELENSPIVSALLKPINHDYIANDTLFVVVKALNDQVAQNLPYLNLCGKSMLDWVLLAGNGCESKVIEDGQVEEKIKNIQTDKKIIAVFYSDTPLLDRNTFIKIMDYFSSRNMNFLRLERGFVVKTEYLKSDPDLHRMTSEFDDKNLMIIDSAKKLNLAHKVLQDRIRNFHINNGVVLLGDQNIFIDCDVEIDKGVIIYPNNIIKGNTIIQSGAILFEGNIIEDSIVSNNTHLKCSYIEKSKVCGEIKNENIINREV